MNVCIIYSVQLAFLDCYIPAQ